MLSGFNPLTASSNKKKLPEPQIHQHQVGHLGHSLFEHFLDYPVKKIPSHQDCKNVKFDCKYSFQETIHSVKETCH